MNRFAQFQGAIGPAFAGSGLRFAPTQNPYVNRVAGYSQSQGVMSIGVQRPRAATATIAGRAGIGCCGDCAKSYRGG